MGADQNLINSVKRMGPSKFRDDSGWVKALGAIGKYAAVKRKQFQVATENFNGVVEDVDIDGLIEYKNEVNGLLKTMKNVPSFMPKYKKAANRYNEIMSNVEGTKTLLTALAAKKVKIGENSSNLSMYQSAAEMSADADVMSGGYTTRMSDDGPMMIFNNGAESILVSDYIAKNPILISDSKTSNDAINTTVAAFGPVAKTEGKEYDPITVKTKVSQDVDQMWTIGNDKTTILFNTNYETKDGSITFMDHLAKTDPTYVKILQDLANEIDLDDNQLRLVDISADALIQEPSNILKRGLWTESDEETLKQKYKEFLQNDVIKHQYDSETTPPIKSDYEQRPTYPTNYGVGYITKEEVNNLVADMRNKAPIKTYDNYQLVYNKDVDSYVYAVEQDFDFPEGIEAGTPISNEQILKDKELWRQGIREKNFEGTQVLADAEAERRRIELETKVKADKEKEANEPKSSRLRHLQGLHDKEIVKIKEGKGISKEKFIEKYYKNVYKNDKSAAANAYDNLIK